MRKLCVLWGEIFCLVVNMVYGQSLDLGLRDNQFSYAGLITHNGWLLRYEQSLLNVKMKEQSGRLFVGYAYETGRLATAGTLYYGTEFGGHWDVIGAMLVARGCWKYAYLEGIINPHKDSALDADLCYQTEGGVTVLARNGHQEKVDVCVSYGNIPEYRMKEKYIRVGMKFTSHNLCVKPMIALPNINGDDGVKTIRVLCSFEWVLKN